MVVGAVRTRRVVGAATLWLEWLHAGKPTSAAIPAESVGRLDERDGQLVAATCARRVIYPAGWSCAGSG